MALQPLIPDPNDPMQSGALPPQLPKNLGGFSAPDTKGLGSLGALPPLSDASGTATGNAGFGGLKPLVTNPRQQQEQELQSKLTQKPQGFWQNLRHVLRTAAMVGGDIVDPGATKIITQQLGREGIGPAANEYRQKQLAGLQAEDKSDQQQFETVQNDTSKRALESAQAGEATARADALENPTEKSAWETAKDFVGPNGEPVQENKMTGEMRIAPNLPSGIKRYEKPATDKPETGAEDDQKYEQVVARGIEGLPLSPEEKAFAKAYKDRKTLGQQVNNFYAGERQQQTFGHSDMMAFDKGYVQPAQPIEKSYQMMNNTYNEYKALQAKGQDFPTGAQSMLALSTHLATTFGNVKGARVTKDMIHEHLGARSISDDALVAIQKLSNGDRLSSGQWDAFHDLIRQSRNETWKESINEAARKGMPMDFLPKDLQVIQKNGRNYAIQPDGTYKAQ